MSDWISKYVIERDAVLEKRSIEELDKFIQANKKEYDRTFLTRWEKASEEVKMITLCKMICNCTRVSKKTQEWARKWLHKKGMLETIL